MCWTTPRLIEGIFWGISKNSAWNVTWSSWFIPSKEILRSNNVSLSENFPKHFLNKLLSLLFYSAVIVAAVTTLWNEGNIYTLKGGIPLRQHSNMLHAIRLSFIICIICWMLHAACYWSSGIAVLSGNNLEGHMSPGCCFSGMLPKYNIKQDIDAELCLTADNVVEKVSWRKWKLGKSYLIIE